MTDKSTRGSGRAGAPKTREDRLKSALKANLQRRKAQARARHAHDHETGSPADKTGTPEAKNED